MNIEILVTVCILTYNHEKTIAQTIDSVLNQKVDFVYEIIVGDDCSTDKTSERLKNNYAKFVKLILREKNIGATRNSLDLFRKASGKYLIFLEGDDYWEHNDTFQYMVDFLETHPSYEGISAKRKRIDKKGNIICDNTDFDINRPVLSLEDYLQGNTFDLVSTLFKNRYNSVDAKAVIRGSRNRGDLVFAILILEKGNLYLTKKYLGYYRSVNDKRAYNYNSRFNAWDKYVEVINILQSLERYHSPYHNYSKRYITESVTVLNYILKQPNGFGYIIRLISLLGINRFAQVFLLYLLKSMISDIKSIRNKLLSF